MPALSFDAQLSAQRACSAHAMIARLHSVTIQLFGRAPTTAARMGCADAGAKRRRAAVSESRIQNARLDSVRFKYLIARLQL